MGDVQSSPPLFSFAVPVRNGARHLPKLLDSLRRQSYPRCEIVVADNASTDDTAQVALAAAAGDPRVRFFQSERNVGQIANFNRVLSLSRGRYVRWIGCDDWLEPTYAERCVEALARAPRAIGVTTYQDHVGDDGARHYAEYDGERLDSDRAERRFRRMLWFCTASYLYIDPIYSTFRRSALERSRQLLVVPDMDQVLAAELAVAGPIVHVPECLAHRRKEDVTKEVVVREYHPERYEELYGLRPLERTIAAMWEPVQRAGLGPLERASCALALARYAAQSGHRTVKPRMRRSARQLAERVSPALVDRWRSARDRRLRRSEQQEERRT